MKALISTSRPRFRSHHSLSCCLTGATGRAARPRRGRWPRRRAGRGGGKALRASWAASGHRDVSTTPQDRHRATPTDAPSSAARIRRKGLWLPVFGILDPILAVPKVPFQPWARAVYDDRQKHELEPHTRCKPSGVARQFLTPYGVEFVEPRRAAARLHLRHRRTAHLPHRLHGRPSAPARPRRPATTATRSAGGTATR